MKADTIFVNGHIMTMDMDLLDASAVVVREGVIQYVGDTEPALNWKGKNTEVVDLEGKTLMPGFIESHVHPVDYAIKLLEIDCRATSAPSIEDVLKKIKEQTQSTPENEWIRGWGWDDSKLKEKRKITRWDLDKVSPNHPVILKRTCGHVAVANSKAFEMSGITKDTSQPKGGNIEYDQSGEMTGILEELAQDLLSLPEYDYNDLKKGFELAQKDFAKWGITTVHDMSAVQENMQLYQDLLSDDNLTVRVRPWIWALNQNGWKGHLNQTLSLGIKSGFGNDMIRIQGMKYMLDGSVGGRTAAVDQPYEDDNHKGILYFSTDEIAPYMKQAILGDLRVAIHAIGERAIEVSIQAFEEAHKEANISNMRNRIEHCALPTEDHLKRMKELGLIAASSIGFIYHIGDSYIKNLGTERMKRVYPHRTFIDYGIVAPGNSDLPVTGGNPWTGIYGAVNRKTISGQVSDSVQNISAYEAVKAYTVDAAYSSCEENIIGVIKASAKADLIIVSENPLEVDTEKLKDLEVEETFMNGKSIYKK
ncbi:amidohydrolase [Ornithinibacillus sp. 4-3]|uniref:Amidohydrolase n=1 Tax=Ornithinibacillus sp. 4-3 TaxID=3231488 RepID=A0AB39HN69_9BACI